MKVILYMAITLNGMIARENGEVDWTSDITWNSYFSFLKRTKNLILGKASYDIMTKKEFDPEVFYVVVTSSKKNEKKVPKIEFVSSPKDALLFLENKGFEEIGVGGGARLNASFMEQNLVDELYIDIEPVILGKGIPLFANQDFEKKLEFIGLKNTGKNNVQLHYRILK